MLRSLRDLFTSYREALSKEPRMRRYLAATLVDDVGIAVTAWASFLLQTNLFTDQRERARLLIPTLVCFLLGNVVSGPIADWAEGRGYAALYRWRFHVVVAGRVIETIALAALVLLIASGAPTITRVLPYMMVSAFMKTALRPTRIAFEVDLLDEAMLEIGPNGMPLLDHHGQPRVQKKYFVAFGALTGALRSLAGLFGLMAGDFVMKLANHAYAPLFAFDVLSNIVFLMIVVRACRPIATTRAVQPQYWTRLERTNVFVAFFRSIREGLRFLGAREHRPLLALLAGSWMVELVTEAYDGKMIIKQVLKGTDEQVRHALIAWMLVSMSTLFVLPVLAKNVRSLGRIFLILMLVDGFVIACAGRIAEFAAATSILPFAFVLGFDHALTDSATTLAAVAANGASGGGMRGRIEATYAFFVLVGDLAMEMLATSWSDRVGLAPMVLQIGLVQVVLVTLLAILGGRTLWNYGIRTRADHHANTAA